VETLGKARIEDVSGGNLRKRIVVSSILSVVVARFAAAAFFPTGAQYSSIHIFIWVPIEAIFDYFCDQDCHEMIALNNEADLSINKKVDSKSNNNEDLKFLLIKRRRMKISY